MDSPSSPPVVRWGIPALIVLLVFVAFWPALDAGFVNWDDHTNFSSNPHYRGLGWDQIRWMWTNTMGHYMPLTWMTLGLDFALWGMEPQGYHRTSVLLHALNGVLAYLFLLRLLRRARAGDDDLWLRLAAFGGALFFAVHPLRAESVAWITERRDLVCGLFFLGSLLAYLRAVPEDGGPARPGPLALSALLFAGSLLGKPSSLPLPAFLLVLDVWVLRRTAANAADGRIWGRLLVEKIPFALLSAGAVGLTWLSTAKAGSFMESQPLLDRVLSPGYRLCFYVAKELLPIGLSPLYPHRSVQSVAEIKYLGGTLAAAGATLLLWRHRRKTPGLLAAWLGFAVLLAPFLGMIQAGPHFAADRYTYLASIPVAALLAAGLGAAFSGARRLPVAAVSSAAALLLVVFSVRQTDIWTDSEKLWTRAIEVDPSELALNNRGTVRLAEGRVQEAIGDFEHALRLQPDYPLALVNLADAHRQSGRLRRALEYAEAAIRLHPNFGTGWRARGEIRAMLGDLAGAEEDCTRAIETDRILLRGYMSRAVIRGMRGKLELAVEDCTAALLLHPYYPNAYINRAVARIEMNDVAGGIDDYTRALAIAPRNADAWAGRGIAFGLANRWPEAVEDFRRALQLAGDRPWGRRADTQRRLEEALRRMR